MSKTYTAPAAFSDEQPLAINMAPVESSQIASIGYDKATKTLAILFARGGALYQYPNVEPEVHAAFIAADSVGKYFGAHIKALSFKRFETGGCSAAHSAHCISQPTGTPIRATSDSCTPAFNSSKEA